MSLFAEFYVEIAPLSQVLAPTHFVLVNGNQQGHFLHYTVLVACTTLRVGTVLDIMCLEWTLMLLSLLQIKNCSFLQGAHLCKWFLQKAIVRHPFVCHICRSISLGIRTSIIRWISGTTKLFRVPQYFFVRN